MAGVVLADQDCLEICDFRSVIAYISAAHRIGGDIMAGWLFPFVTAEGGRGRLSLSAARLTVSLQSDLWIAEPPNHFRM